MTLILKLSKNTMFWQLTLTRNILPEAFVVVREASKRSIGQRHYDVSQEVIRLFQRYEELRRIVMVIGIDELSKAHRTLYERARKIQNFLTQPFAVAEKFTGKKGDHVEIRQTLDGCERILNGQVDKKPESESGAVV